eukprot:GDKJ01022709.1.p1 GENE.GDKJ01022709.1~~GDKJ01022709.1.p1  ORF type:complete len:544 (+),score=153.92 GDKJ01022709.1:36-1634(+)
MYKVFAFAVLALATVFGADDEHVAVLTSSNFTDYIKNNPLTLVEFYAPWCGHCKSLEPHYNEAAHALHQKKAKSKLAKVDATAEPVLASEYGVSGYPTLKYFVDSEPSEYNGPREAKGITEWLLKREKPNVKKLRNSANAAEWLSKQSENSVVAYIHGRNHESVFRRVTAQMMDEIEAFVYVPVESAAEERLEIHRKGVPEKSAVASEESGVFTLQGFKSFESSKKIKDALDNARFPLIGAGRKFSASMYAYSKTKNIALVILPFSTDADVEQKVIDTMLPFAKKYHNELFFTIAFEGEANMSQITDLLGPGGAPEIMILDRRHGLAAFESSGEMIRPHKYRLGGDASAELTDSASIEKFFDSWKKNNGSLEKWLKEQTRDGAVESFEKEKDPQGFVSKFVASDVDKGIFLPENNGKDFLILYYAPWCGHCKSMKADYVKLAEILKKEGQDNVVVAAMDATANDVAVDTISGYPTIVFYPAGNSKDKRLRNKVKYQGGRTLDDMYNFLSTASEVWNEKPTKAHKNGRDKSEL